MWLALNEHWRINVSSVMSPVVDDENVRLGHWYDSVLCASFSSQYFDAIGWVTLKKPCQ